MKKSKIFLSIIAGLMFLGLVTSLFPPGNTPVLADSPYYPPQKFYEVYLPPRPADGGRLYVRNICQNGDMLAVASSWSVWEWNRRWQKIDLPEEFILFEWCSYALDGEALWVTGWQDDSSGQQRTKLETPNSHRTLVSQNEYQPVLLEVKSGLVLQMPTEVQEVSQVLAFDDVVVVLTVAEVPGGPPIDHNVAYAYHTDTQEWVHHELGSNIAGIARSPAGNLALAEWQGGAIGYVIEEVNPYDLTWIRRISSRQGLMVRDMENAADSLFVGTEPDFTNTKPGEATQFTTGLNYTVVPATLGFPPNEELMVAGNDQKVVIAAQPHSGDYHTYLGISDLPISAENWVTRTIPLTEVEGIVIEPAIMPDDTILIGTHGLLFASRQPVTTATITCPQTVLAGEDFTCSLSTQGGDWTGVEWWASGELYASDTPTIAGQWPTPGNRVITATAWNIANGTMPAVAQAEMQVLERNAPPQAADDLAETEMDVAIAIDVLANDWDPNSGDLLTVTAVGQPQVGTAFTGGDMVTYTPAVGWTGQDIFTYTVSDGELTDTATVTVTVNPASANHAPTLHVITPPPTGTVGIHYDFDQIVGLDYDGDALTFSAAGLPAGLRPTQLDQYPGAIKGFIRGTPTSPGTSLVNLSLTDGLITTTTTITITVVAAPIPTGGGQIFLPVVIK